MLIKNSPQFHCVRRGLLAAMAVWFMAPLAAFAAAPQTGSNVVGAAVAVANSGTNVDVTGTLEVSVACFLKQHRAEHFYSVIEDKTGRRYTLKFQGQLKRGHLTGERVRVRGRAYGSEITLPAVATASESMNVLAAAPAPTNGLIQTVTPKSVYGGGTNANTVIHRTLIELLNYSDWATDHYTASDITWWSNQVFAVTGNSVNTEYLEDSYGAIGFAGDVVICHIADTSGDYSTSTWMSQGDAAATAQGYTPGNYLHKLYVTSGAGGWAGLATVGYGWAMVYYSDGGTICHELGHNLGFAHASTQWGNTSPWVEYGDGSDFMGANYTWQQNNAPHKIQQGWLTPQTVTQPGTYRISRVEDVPSTVPYPEVLTFPSSTATGMAVDGWPYYLSYKQNVGMDSVGGNYIKGLNIDRWGGGGSHTAAIALLQDGTSFTDPGTGWIIQQISHNTNYVTFGMGFTTGVTAQPITVAVTGDQLSAHTPVVINMPNSTGDPLTVTNFDVVSANGGTVTYTNNQFTYTPPGLFAGSDTFNYSAVDVFDMPSSATVTIYPVTQNYYTWDANGAAGGTGGSGNWDTTSLTWDSGAHFWPTTGTSNWAFFGGTPGTVSLASGVAANGLLFSTDGYVIQNNTLTLNGSQPTIFVQPGVGAEISSTVTGAAGLTKSGSGLLRLGGNNSYTGGTTLSSGTLVLGGTNAIGAGPLTIDGGALDSSVPGLVNTANNPQNWNGDFTFAGSQDLNLGNGPVTPHASRQVTVSSANLTVGGAIGGGAISLTKSGPGQLTLTGANTYSGATTIDGGTLQLGDGVAHNGSVAGDIANNATLKFANPGAQTFSNVISGAGAVIKNGAGALTLSTVNSTTGSLTVNAGTLAITAGTSGGNGSALGTGANAITINSGGTLLFNGSSSRTAGYHTGPVNLNGGTLTFNTADNSLAVGNTVTLNSAPCSINGTSPGQWRFRASATMQVNAPASGSVIGGTLDFNLFDGTETFNVASGTGLADLIVSAPMSGGGNLNKSGSGKMLVTGANTYSGNTTVNGGTLEITGGIYRGGYFSSPVVTVNSGGVLELNNWQYNITTGALGGLTANASGVVVNGGTIAMNNTVPTSYGRGVTVNSGGATLDAGGTALWTIDVVTDNNAWVYNGNPPLTLTGNGAGGGEFDKVFSGTNGLTKAGSGTWTLTGANTYTGPTVVTDGKLLVNGSLAAGSEVTVSGGALGGTGTIGGPVTVNAGGTLSPGTTSIAALTINNTLTLSGNALMHLDHAAGISDLVQGLTTVNYGGTLTLTNLSGTLAAGDSFTLFTSGNYQGSFNSVVMPVLGAGLAWDISALPTDGSVKVVAFNGINPPTTWPANLTATPVDPTQIALSWSAVSNATSYVISRDGTVIATVTGASFQDSALSPATTYCYSLTAVNSGGSSSTSPSVCATTTITGATLTWDADFGASGAQDGSGIWGSSAASWFYNNNDLVWADGNSVVFGVNATTNCVVTLTNDVTPTSLTFNAIGGSYTLGGSGALFTPGASLPVVANGNANIGVVINGSGGLTKSGSGVLTLSAVNGNSGSLTVNAGTLAVTAGTSGGNASALGTGANAITVTNGGTLLFNGGSSRTAGYHTGPVYLDGGTLTFNTADNSFAAGNTVTLNSAPCSINGTSPGQWRFRASATMLVNASASGSAIGGTFDFNLYNGTETFNVADGTGPADLTVSAAMTGGGSLNKSGSGTMVVSGANTYSGNTTVNGGTLQITGGIYRGAYFGSPVVTVNSGGVLALNNWQYNISTGALGGLTANASGVVVNGGTIAMNNAVPTSYGRGVTVNNGGAILKANGSALWTVDVVTDSHAWVYNGNPALVLSGNGSGGGEFDKVFSGTNGLTKTGSATWTLGGANTYSGPTLVSDGKLLVNGSLAAGSKVTVSGGALGGTGTIGGPVTVNAGGTLSPGTTGAGTLTIGGGLALDYGSTNTFEVDGSAPANGQVVLAGGVSYGGTLNVVPTGTFTSGQTFTLFGGTGAASASNFAHITGSPGSGLQFSFTNGVLSVVSSVATPVMLTNNIIGNTLSLSWPAGQGWRLEWQTNALNSGLGTNWLPLTDGSVNSTNIPVDATRPAVFYRLVNP